MLWSKGKGGASAANVGRAVVRMASGQVAGSGVALGTALWYYQGMMPLRRNRRAFAYIYVGGGSRPRLRGAPGAG